MIKYSHAPPWVTTNEVSPVLVNECNVYRKPSTLFAKEIMNDFGFMPSELCYVGDRLSDLQTALNIGANAIGVNTGLINLHIEVRESFLNIPFPIFSNFSEVIENLFKN